MRNLRQDRWEETGYFVASRYLPGHCSCCPITLDLKSANQIDSIEILPATDIQGIPTKKQETKSDYSYTPRKKEPGN